MRETFDQTMGLSQSQPKNSDNHELSELRQVEGGENQSEENPPFPYQGDVLEGLQLDRRVKIFWKACQEENHSSLPKLISEEDTLEKIVKVKDKNGMNILHVLLFDAKNDNEKWFTNSLDTVARTNIVKFIEAICQNKKISFKPMMNVQDKYNRTPLHYAGMLDNVMNENDESNITLALLKYGADKALFVKDINGHTPVNFIKASCLKAHLDTKHTIKGPGGHEKHEYDVSILKPEPKKNTCGFEYLEMLADKHKDLFDHPVVSALIW